MKTTFGFGIIGCGAIGSAVAKIANYFRMKVLVNSYSKRTDIASFAEYLSLENQLDPSYNAHHLFYVVLLIG